MESEDGGGPSGESASEERSGEQRGWDEERHCGQGTAGTQAREARPGHGTASQVEDRVMGAEAWVQPCATRISFRKSQLTVVWETHGKQQVGTRPQKPPTAKLREDLGPSRGTLEGFWAEEGFDPNSVLGRVIVPPLFCN